MQVSAVFWENYQDFCTDIIMKSEKNKKTFVDIMCTIKEVWNNRCQFPKKKPAILTMAGRNETLENLTDVTWLDSIPQDVYNWDCFLKIRQSTSYAFYVILTY